MLSRADNAASRGSKHQAGNRDSLQQTSDSTPSSSHQNSTGAGTAQRDVQLQHAEGVGTSQVDAGKHDAAASASPHSWSCLNGLEFLDNLKNPKNLQPAALPLELKLFSRIPVVVSARLFGQTGMPSETFARLLLT